MNAAPVVFLSPHLDDAVLSCGARIGALGDAGRAVKVVTLFAADEPERPLSPLAADLRRWWNLPAGGIARARRAEDAEACAALGALAEPWDLPEAPNRLAADGTVLYPTLAALYGEVAAPDRALEEEIARRLAELGQVEILAPLGVGGHVDHLLARRAAERLGRDLAYYEEFPYVEWKWLALGRALGRPREWRSDALAVSDELFERKVAAILAYRSQVPAMFRGEARLRKQLRRQLRRAGGERIWRRARSAAG
ncbi:MAG: PIG-L family deacetylase [Thermoanaerobaculia bacterium]